MNEDWLMESALFPWLDSDSMADPTDNPGEFDDLAEIREMAGRIERLCYRWNVPVPPNLDDWDYEDLDALLGELQAREG